LAREPHAALLNHRFNSRNKILVKRIFTNGSNIINPLHPNTCSTRPTSACGSIPDGMGMMSTEGFGRIRSWPIRRYYANTHKSLVKVADNSTRVRTGYVLELKSDLGGKKPPVETLRLSSCVMFLSALFLWNNDIIVV
jgi:hypothetical protein